MMTRAGSARTTLLAGKQNSLRSGGRAAKTIRDSKLAPVRATFQCAVDNRKLDANPAARINIDLRSRSSEKR